MSINIGSPSTSESKAHQRSVESLKAQQKNELDILKNNHESNKQKIQISNEQDLMTIKSSGDQEKLQAIDRKNKILESLDKQINQIKEIHAKEQANLDNNNKAAMEQKRLTHQYALKNRSEKMQDDIEAQTADSSFQIGKLRKAYQREREQLETTHNSQISNERHLSQAELESQKKEYTEKKDSLQRKYETALRQLKQENTYTLTREEVQGQAKVKKSKMAMDRTLENTIRDGQRQIETQNNRFENEFSTQKEKHENLLQKLDKNKSALIQKYKNDIYQEVNVLEDKSRDPFYSATDITPSVREDSQSYQLTINTSKDQADYYSLTGSGRELKLSMSRRFNDKVIGENGEKSLIAKTESVSKTIKLDEIIDPKTIKKAFENGVLEFVVSKA